MPNSSPYRAETLCLLLREAVPLTHPSPWPTKEIAEAVGLLEFQGAFCIYPLCPNRSVLGMHNLGMAIGRAIHIDLLLLVLETLENGIS